MTPNIRLITVDLDGTLLRNDKTISTRNIRALKQARSEGIKIAVNSGRTLYSIRELVPDDLYDYACCCNGYEIYDIHTGRSECGRSLTGSEIDEIYQKASRLMLLVILFSEGRTVIGSHRWFGFLLKHFRHFRTLFFKDGWKSDEFEYGTSAHLKKYTAPKLCFASLHSVLSLFASSLNEEKYNVVFVGPNWLEVMPAQTSKGNAVRSILEQEGLSKDQALGFGDGNNDLEMLEACGTSVAMKNAMPDVLKNASCITLSNMDDGIADYLEKYVLQEGSCPR